MALWMASNRNHVHLFARALRERGPGDAVLSLDAYYAQGATQRASELGLPCIELPAPPELDGRFGNLPWAQRRGLVPSLAWLCRAWFETRELDVLVAANDTGLVEECLLAARRVWNVPALLVQEGDFGSDWHRDRKPGQKLIGEGGCEAIAVWGERGRRYAEALDIEAALLVTGCAKLPETGPTREGLRSSLGLAPDARVALLGLQCLERYGAAPPGRERSLYEATVKALLEDASQHVLVSPHPSHTPDERAFYRGLCDREARTHYVEDPDGGALLAACDVLVALHSTLLTEAAAVEVPAVCIDPSELTREAPAERVHDAGALARLCGSEGWLESLRARLTPRQRTFADETYAEIGAPAASQLARAVEAIALSSGRGSSAALQSV